MPLRDHFRPPLDASSAWEGFHGQWPAVIVQHLRSQLPTGYVAEPRVHSGSQVEIDVAAFEKDEPPSPLSGTGQENGGLAVAVWAPPLPSVAVETTLPDYDEYEVRIYDAKRGRHLVAAIEIVSPANKDRPEHRNVFVARCAALLQKGVAVSIVDLVTIRQFNLYAELLRMIGHGDPTLGAEPEPLYAASCRWVKRGKRTLLEARPGPALGREHHCPLRDLSSSFATPAEVARPLGEEGGSGDLTSIARSEQVPGFQKKRLTERAGGE